MTCSIFPFASPITLVCHSLRAPNLITTPTRQVVTPRGNSQGNDSHRDEKKGFPNTQLQPPDHDRTGWLAMGIATRTNISRK